MTTPVSSQHSKMNSIQQHVAYGLYVEHGGELVLQFPIRATYDECASDLKNYARTTNYEIRKLYVAPEAPAKPDFDEWTKNPYTKVLEKSVANDYIPKYDLPMKELVGGR